MICCVFTSVVLTGRRPISAQTVSYNTVDKKVQIWADPNPSALGTNASSITADHRRATIPPSNGTWWLRARGAVDWRWRSTVTRNDFVVISDERCDVQAQRPSLQTSSERRPPRPSVHSWRIIRSLISPPAAAAATTAAASYGHCVDCRARRHKTPANDALLQHPANRSWHDDRHMNDISYTQCRRKYVWSAQRHAVFAVCWSRRLKVFSGV